MKNEGNALAISVGFGVLIGAMSHRCLSKFRLSGRFLDVRRRPHPLSGEWNGELPCQIGFYVVIFFIIYADGNKRYYIFI